MLYYFKEVLQAFNIHSLRKMSLQIFQCQSEVFDGQIPCFVLYWHDIHVKWKIYAGSLLGKHLTDLFLSLTFKDVGVWEQSENRPLPLLLLLGVKYRQRVEKHILFCLYTWMQAIHAWIIIYNLFFEHQFQESSEAGAAASCALLHFNLLVL